MKFKILNASLKLTFTDILGEKLHYTDTKMTDKGSNLAYITGFHGDQASPSVFL